MKTKLSWKHYIYITGGIFAILSVFLGIGTRAAVTGITRMLDTGQVTLEKVQELREDVIEIRINQTFLRDRLEEEDEDREEGPHH